ncbi:DUF374 domain-containing protein [Planctomycetales bacterium 10988]|nr:DUF374 domain-containing protein [Planctomycetales bacterium 10988]
MKRLNNYLARMAGCIGANLVRQWYSTTDFRAVYYNPEHDLKNPHLSGGVYLGWHEYVLAPLYARGGCRMTVLVSQHRDAEILAKAVEMMGATFERGSTKRGGAGALKKMMEAHQHQHIAMTPDGPRGPRRQLAKGPIYLASRLGRPIYCIGIGMDRPYRFNSWDKFAVPRPFSRVRAIVGPPIYVPQDLPRSEIETYRQLVNDTMDELTDFAERWAVSGKRHPLEHAVKRCGISRVRAQQEIQDPFASLQSSKPKSGFSITPAA